MVRILALLLSLTAVLLMANVCRVTIGFSILSEPRRKTPFSVVDNFRPNDSDDVSNLAAKTSL